MGTMTQFSNQTHARVEYMKWPVHELVRANKKHWQNEGQAPPFTSSNYRKRN